MADAGGGGGSEWGPWEIILVLILAIGLLHTLTGKKFTPIFSPTTETGQTISTPQPVCAIKILQPRAQQKVTTAVTVAGSISGCNVQTTNQTAVRVQVVDSFGMPVSAYTPIPISTYTNGAVSFYGTVPLNTAPNRGIGYVIIAPAEAVAAKTVRIPISL